MKVTGIVLYVVLRLAIFAAATALLILLGIAPWLAAVIGAVIALCISIIFLSGPRNEVSRSLSTRRRKASRDVDAEHEDALGEP